MGKMLKEFKATVPVSLLERAEAEELPKAEARTEFLNKVMQDFYYPKTDKSLMMHLQNPWVQVAAVNSAIEQGLREYPNCLAVFQFYVYKNIGISVLSDGINAADYQTARRLLYATKFEDGSE